MLWSPERKATAFRSGFRLGARQVPRNVYPEEYGMRKRILVIEDDPNVLEYMINFLQSGDYDAVGAQNGNTALDIAAGTPFDLITLNMEMHNDSGAVVYKELASSSYNRETPFIFVGGPKDIHQAIPNAVATVTKPFDPDRMLTIIRQTLGE